MLTEMAQCIAMELLTPWYSRRTEKLRTFVGRQTKSANTVLDKRVLEGYLLYCKIGRGLYTSLQILTSKVNPRTVRLQIFIMIVDP